MIIEILTLKLTKSGFCGRFVCHKGTEMMASRFVTAYKVIVIVAKRIVAKAHRAEG